MFSQISAHLCSIYSTHSLFIFFLYYYFSCFFNFFAKILCFQASSNWATQQTKFSEQMLGISQTDTRATGEFSSGCSVYVHVCHFTAKWTIIVAQFYDKLDYLGVSPATLIALETHCFTCIDVHNSMVT